MKAYPPGFLKVFWWVLAILFVSGLLLLPGMLELRLGWALPSALKWDARVWWAALHGLAAFAALLAIGALLPLHVRSGLRRGKNLKSGIGVLAVVGGLALTGWLIYYVSDERFGAWASVVHCIVGMGAALLVAVHVILGRRVQSEQAATRLHRAKPIATAPEIAAQSDAASLRHQRRA